VNRAEFGRVMAETFEGLQSLSNSKGAEYADSDKDQLANFKHVALAVESTPTKVLGVYLLKHLGSITRYIRGHESSEPIESRIDDAILYLILLKCLIKESNMNLARSGAGRDLVLSKMEAMTKGVPFSELPPPDFP
jgi:hypothetical protein